MGPSQISSEREFSGALEVTGMRRHAGRLPFVLVHASTGRPAEKAQS